MTSATSSNSLTQQISFFQKILPFIVGMLFSIWIIGNCYNFTLGLADNGDWYRSTMWFSSGPIGIQEDYNLPPQQQYQRYFKHWIPRWQIDLPALTPDFFSEATVSSNLLLWAPGVLFSYLHAPDHVLYIPYVTLFSRLWIGVSLALIFLWIIRYFPTQAWWLLLSVGIPLVLLTITPAYNGFINSFFQESGDLVFFLCLVAMILWFTTNPSSRLFFFGILLAGLLISTSKVSHFYMPILIGVFTISFKPVQKFSWHWVFIISTAIAPLLLMGSTQSDEMMALNRFNRVFTGILPFSDRTKIDLDTLGLSGLENCIDELDYYSTNRKFCFETFGAGPSTKDTLLVLLRSPQIFVKQIHYVAEHFQKISLRNEPYENFNLGNFAFGDQREPKENLFWSWEVVKELIFPRGWSLWIFLSLFIATSTIIAIRNQSLIPFLKINLLLTVILVVEMMIAILGDGKYELTKHLFLANLVFDIILCLAIPLWIAILTRPLFKKE